MGEYGGKQRNQLGKVVRRSESKDVQLQRFADNRPRTDSQLNLINSIQKKPNNTGLPDSLKFGVENLSGYSMEDVKVHYNSDKPAQLNALAYAQGTDIHIGPGQEKHLPHEAWHVVQQKQGRVQPTMQMQGINVNDNEGLEKEADVMGGKVVQKKSVIQCDFGELGGGAQYTSQSHNPVVGGPPLDGSIYFPLGRLRLIHDDGPQISLHPHTRRYIIIGDFTQFQQEYRAQNIRTLQKLEEFVQGGRDRWRAQPVNPDHRQPQAVGRLFEVILDEHNVDKVKGYHSSRGGIAALANAPGGGQALTVDNQRRLYYIVHYSEQLAKEVRIKHPGVADDELIKNTINDRVDELTGGINSLFLNDEQEAARDALLVIENSIGVIIADINNAIPGMFAVNDRRRCGVFGNIFLRHSFDFAGAGLNIRAHN